MRHSFKENGLAPNLRLQADVDYTRVCLLLVCAFRK